MPRVNFVQKARQSKRPRNCRICGHEVAPGESYRYIRKRVGLRGTAIFHYCFRHQPRPSHLLSGRQAELASMVEGFEDALEDSDDIKEAMETLCMDLESFIEEIESGAQNIEEHFGETEQSAAMSSAADELRPWLDDLQNLEQEIPDGYEPEENAEDDESEDYAQRATDVLGDMPEVSFSA